MQNKTLAIFMPAGVLMIISFIPVALAAEVEGEVTITSGDCGLTADSNIDFGSLSNGQESSLKNLKLSNPGDSEAAVQVRGSNWKTSEETQIMSVGNTHYGLASDFASMSPLTTADTDAGLFIPPHGQIYLIWQLKPDLTGGSAAFTGDLTQIITITGIC